MEPRLRHYRAIATASRKRLDRARWLFARLTLNTVRGCPFPKLAHHEAAERAKAAGIYSPNTATGDVEYSLAQKWGRLSDVPRDGWERFVRANGISFRYTRYEIEQQRAKRRAAENEKPACPLTMFPGGFWGE